MKRNLRGKIKKLNLRFDFDRFSIMMIFLQFPGIFLVEMKANQYKLKLLALFVMSLKTNAGAFSLYTEGSASAVGNYAAGIAAEGRDASVGWYNPAALVLLRDTEVLGGVVGVLPTANLSGTSNFFQNGGVEFLNYKESFQNLNGGREAILPNFHVAIPVGERVTYGFSAVVPMGLATSWPEDSALRYAGTLSALRVVDLSPEMGGKITDQFAVGWGLDLEYSDVDFNNVLGVPILDPTNPSGLDSQLTNHGQSWGLGFHAGLLLMSKDQNSRFGFNYQYGITHQFMDASRLTGPLADPEAVFSSPLLESNLIKLPDILTFSLFQKVGDKVAMMGSLVYTLWSPLKTIELRNVAAYDAQIGTVYKNVTTQQNYRDALRFALGMNYDVLDNWQLRWGLGYDQTPTNSIDRDIRLPDVDKIALALGLQWKYNQHWLIDAGYSYLFPSSDVSVHKTQILDQYNYLQVDATGHAYAQLLAIQAIWRA
jgi:long-chain fatty acid transport protein